MAMQNRQYSDERIVQRPVWQVLSDKLCRDNQPANVWQTGGDDKRRRSASGALRGQEVEVAWREDKRRRWHVVMTRGGEVDPQEAT
jgi:hypothetical protein